MKHLIEGMEHLGEPIPRPKIVVEVFQGMVSAVYVTDTLGLRGAEVEIYDRDVEDHKRAIATRGLKAIY